MPCFFFAMAVMYQDTRLKELGAKLVFIFLCFATVPMILGDYFGKRKEIIII